MQEKHKKIAFSLKASFVSENGIKTRKKIHVGIKELQLISPQLEIRGYSTQKKRRRELRHKKTKHNESQAEIAIERKIQTRKKNEVNIRLEIARDARKNSSKKNVITIPANE